MDNNEFLSDLLKKILYFDPSIKVQNYYIMQSLKENTKKSWQEPKMSSLDISGGATANIPEASNGILES